MFKINIFLKIALIALFLGGGIVLWITNGLIYSWPLLLVGILLFVSYVMLGTVQSTADLIQKMQFEKAEKRLNLTLTPKLLYVTNRAFYFIMKGAIAMNNKDMDAGEALFDKALSMKLPSDNERGMVLLQLANIKASKNKWSAAKKHYLEAKKLKITESQIKQQLAEFEKALSNRGQMKVATSMGKRGMQMMKGMGGKRRRPKMR